MGLFDKLIDIARNREENRDTAQSTSAAPSSNQSRNILTDLTSRATSDTGSSRRNYIEDKTSSTRDAALSRRNALTESLEDRTSRARNNLETARTNLGYATDPWMEQEARNDYNKAQQRYNVLTGASDAKTAITKAANDVFNRTTNQARNWLTNLAAGKTNTSTTSQTETTPSRTRIPIEYSDAFLRQEETKDAWSPNWTNGEKKPETTRTLPNNGYVPTNYLRETPAKTSEGYKDPNAGKSMAGNSMSRALQENQKKPDTNIFRQDTADIEEDSPAAPFFDRAAYVASGAAKQYGSGLENLYGTTTLGLSELGDTLGGNTNPYAGYSTDPLSSAQIGYEHDPAYYEAEQNYSRTVQAAADQLSESATADLEKAKNGLGKIGQAGVDIATNIIQMGFDAALGGATGLGSLAMMFLRSAGSGAQEARQAGASTGRQLLYGGTSGTIEVITEKIADGLAGIYGKGKADEAIEEAIRRLAKTDVGRSFLRFVANTGSEGVEEVVSDLLDPLAKTIYNNKQLYDSYAENLKLEDILYDFLIGAAVGGVGAVANIAKGGDAYSNFELRSVDALQENLIANGVDPQFAQEAAKILSDLADGKRISIEDSEYLDYISEHSGGLNTTNPLVEAEKKKAEIREKAKRYAQERADAIAASERMVAERDKAVADAKAFEERAAAARAKAEERTRAFNEAKAASDKLAEEHARVTAEANEQAEKAAEAHRRAEQWRQEEAQAKAEADRLATERKKAQADVNAANGKAKAEARARAEAARNAYLEAKAREDSAAKERAKAIADEKAFEEKSKVARAKAEERMKALTEAREKANASATEREQAIAEQRRLEEEAREAQARAAEAEEKAKVAEEDLARRKGIGAEPIENNAGEIESPAEPEAEEAESSEEEAEEPEEEEAPTEEEPAEEEQPSEEAWDT